MTEKAKTYRGVFIDTYGTGRASVREISSGSEAIAELLGVELIDYQSVTVGGHAFDVWVDDNGLYSHGRTPAFSVMHENSPVLCGPAFILNGDNETGESFSLSPDEISLIMGNIRPRIISYRDGPSYAVDVLSV